MRKKIGLALSGGAARGIAHIGVLKALDEMDIKPDIISGSSAGAMMGAFYAAGFTPDEMRSIVLENTFFHIRDIAFSKAGILNSSANEKMLRRYLKRISFNQLKIPLLVIATDIKNAEAEVLSTGDVVKAILASSAIPVLFKPVKHNHKFLIDGSIVSCLPAELLVKKCDIIIGSHVNPVYKTRRKMVMLDIFDRSFHLAAYSEVKNKMKLCDIFIEPPSLSEFTMRDFKKVDDLINTGYIYTLKLRKKLLKAIK